MVRYLNMTIDYLEGRIIPTEYESMIESNDNLYQWIQRMVPAGKQFSYCTPPSKELVFYPYYIREVMRVHGRLSWGGPKGTPSYHYHIHTAVLQLFTYAFPDIQISPDTRVSTMHELSLAAVPSYIGGSEVLQSNIIGILLESVPLDLPLPKQKQLAKERIKKAFHIEGNRHPYWIQSPEWPMRNGVPMRYLRTEKVNSEHKRHIFQDIENGESRIVEDFH